MFKCSSINFSFFVLHTKFTNFVANFSVFLLLSFSYLGSQLYFGTAKCLLLCMYVCVNQSIIVQSHNTQKHHKLTISFTLVTIWHFACQVGLNH